VHPYEVLRHPVITEKNKRRIGRYQVLTRSWKKAIVTLKPGDSIQFFEGV